MSNVADQRRQGIYWILTVPLTSQDMQRTHGARQILSWIEASKLPKSVAYAKGQLERGESGYHHFQLVLGFRKKQSLNGIKSILGTGVHAELTRSEAAEAYVHKEETYAGYRFELGTRPQLRQSQPIDWDAIWNLAVSGRMVEIPASIRVRSYRTLRQIESDNSKAFPLEKTVHVYWGVSGSGKSHRAWSEAGMDAYPKDPNTKFWYGYSGQKCVVIDEFRGNIHISHLLRWLDKYPHSYEVKGSHVVPRCESIWITSNLPPNEWYPGLDGDTLAALMRRFTTVTKFLQPFARPICPPSQPTDSGRNGTDPQDQEEGSSRVFWDSFRLSPESGRHRYVGSPK